MAVQQHTASEPYVHPDDPAGWLKPGEPFMVDGLDWSWAFAWFKEVPGSSGYCVGSNGTVWSRQGRGCKPKLKKLWRKRKPYQDHKGYWYVALKIHGVGRKRRIHRLVLSVFRGDCPEGMEGRHIDGNKSNNNLHNLSYGTQEENRADIVRHGTRPMGSAHCISKLREEDIPVIRRLASEGWTLREIGDLFGVIPGTIHYAVTGKTWKHVPNIAE